MNVTIITVNKLDNDEVEMKFDAGHVQAAIDVACVTHPDWTSMVVTIVRELNNGQE